jgi:hypothetical protein
MDSIHYKESLMLLKTFMAAFELLILQGFLIKQEKLIGQKLFLVLQDIRPFVLQGFFNNYLSWVFFTIICSKG